MDVGFWMLDPNDDPFNSDANGIVLVPYWEFELPQRAYRARYEFSISASFSIGVNTESNNMVGFSPIKWRCIVNGWLKLIHIGDIVRFNFTSSDLVEEQDNQQVVLGDKPIHYEMSMDDETQHEAFKYNYDSGLVSMNRSIDVEAAGVPDIALLAFPCLFVADRSIIQSGIQVTLERPQLSCTIVPL